MTLRTKFGLGVALTGCLALAGCSCLRDFDGRSATGFAAPGAAPHRAHRAAHAEPASAPESALAKCSRALYLEYPKSREELKSLEEKCRAVIVNQ